MIWWKERADIFNRENGLIKKYYPSLTFKDNGEIISLEGEVVLRTISYIPKNIKIKIIFPPNYPKSLPKVYDVERKFGGYNRDRHIDKDNSFCLFLPEKVGLDLEKKHTILNFLERYFNAFSQETVCL